MLDELPVELACPNCRNILARSHDDDQANCLACGGRFALSGHFCPECGHYQPKETSKCDRCGAVLSVACESCYQLNWAAEPICFHCAQTLNASPAAAESGAPTTATVLAPPAPGSRAATSIAGRLSALLAAETARQVERRQQLRLLSRQEHQLTMLVLIGVVLFLLFLVVLAYVNSPS